LISILAAWFYIFALCSLYGGLLVVGIRHFTLAKNEELPIAIFPLLGLAAVSILTLCLSFLIGIGLEANLIILGLALFVGCLNRVPLLAEAQRSLAALRPLPSLYILLLGLLGTVLAFKSSVGRTLLHFDTGYYHAQSIEWIIQYGLVPGLGNLHTPLAYDSLWFQPCALFSFTFLLHQPLHALVGFVSFIVFCFALSGLHEVLFPRTDIRFSSVVQALLLIPLIELASNLSSPSTDEPTSLFMLFLFALFCRYAEQEAVGELTAILQCSIALLAIFTTLLKLSALPVLLFIPYMAYRSLRQGKIGIASVYALVFPLLWIPKLARTVILSGYLVYPYPNIDLFSVDWKMPLAVVQDQKRYIESWGRAPFADPNVVLAQGFWSWFPNWFANFSKGYAAVGLLIACLSIMAFFCLQIFQRPSRTAIKQNFECYGAVYTISFIGVIYWFSISPLLRYGFGFFWSLIVLLIAPLVYQLSKLVPKVLKGNLGEKAFIAIAIVLVPFVLLSDCPPRALGTGIVLSRYYITNIRSLLLQEKYPSVPTLSGQVGKLSIYRPVQGELCWDHALPCTPYLYTAIESRGLSLRDGFRPSTGSIGIFDAKRIAAERRNTNSPSK
jgi:hypothetical protein